MAAREVTDMTKPIALAGIVAALLLGGCANQPFTKADIDGRIVCNYERMDQVERLAKRQATAVYWINCPTATLRTS
jgi:hypothetical protein